MAELELADASWAGSKAVRLGLLMQEGLAVPAGVCISAAAYERFLAATELGPRIQILLHRKRFEDMRWEELWDLSLRIRNLFLRTQLPKALDEALRPALRETFADAPVAVRSAAIGEDSGQSSFAGLHDSFVDLRGAEAILDGVKRVWASLWSDRALLYRKELGLDPAQSAIAVVVQQLVVGRASGVLFTQSPVEPSEAIVESVWGLNQGLVDGTVAPDRWHLDRATGEVRRHVPTERTEALRLGPVEPVLTPLEPSQREAAPLAGEEVRLLWRLGGRIEQLFGEPQDVEWTLADGDFAVLQARPITTRPASEDDPRSWYLSLHRSRESLRSLRETIEQQVLPGMAAAAEQLSEVDLSALDAGVLAAEIRRRQEAAKHWIDVYWRECIPFAHGVRLFGQIYNDRVAPPDPFEFVELLEDTELLAQKRNAELQALAATWREVRAGRRSQAELDAAADRFLERHGLGFHARDETERQGLERLLGQLGEGPSRQTPTRREPKEARQAFLERFQGADREAMAELLELARASYRLRDDDNIYLGRIDAELQRALEQGRLRLADRGLELAPRVDAADIVHALEDPSFHPQPAAEPPEAPRPFALRARQLVGQPASPGLSTGPARVVRGKADLLRVERGDVLVCDALDPTMTVVAPLVVAIVERRGGMLIHGAIIAREYGVPCVTGVPDLLAWIANGDHITVDGHVGLVTVAARHGNAER